LITGKLPDLIVDNYSLLEREDAAIAQRLDDTFPEICAAFEPGDDEQAFWESIRNAYMQVFFHADCKEEDKPPSAVKCPLVDGTEIAAGDCIENRDIADGNLKEQHLPEKYKQHSDWKEICKNCKWHYY
jgi:hypothetical protein